MPTTPTPENGEQLNQTPGTVKDSIKETVFKTAEWFLPVVGLTYACGFLIVFTFFKSFGINTVEFIEAKYIHIGSLFVMACITIILPMHWMARGIGRWFAGKNKRNAKKLVRRILRSKSFWIISWKAVWRYVIKKFFWSDWQVSGKHGIHATFPVLASATCMLWCFLLLLAFAKPDFLQTHSRLLFFNLLFPLVTIALAIPADWIRNKSVLPQMASSKFSGGDLADLWSLAKKLERPADAISNYLKERLSPATLTALAKYQGSDSDPIPLQKALVNDLNRIIRSHSMYDAQRFDGVSLRSESKILLAQNPPGDALQHLNRLLLEDAYPLDILRKQKADNEENEDFLYPWPRSILTMGKSLIRIWWLVVGLRYLYLFFVERPLFFEADQHHPDGQLHQLVIRFFGIPLVTITALWFLLFFWPGNNPAKKLRQRLTITRWVLYPIQWALFLGQFWFFLRVIIKENLGVSLREVFVGTDWHLCASSWSMWNAMWRWICFDETIKEEQIHKLFPVGGVIFIFFVVLLVFFAFRNFYRIKQMQDYGLRNMVSTFSLLGVLFYFAIVSFAHSIYPYIPAAKGGGDYTLSHPVQLTFNAEYAQSIPPAVTNGIQDNCLILLDENSSFVFLASTNDAGGPAKWRNTTNKPTVYEIRRDAIVSITYTNPSVVTTSSQAAR
jgi:hypothetical protein